MSKFCFPVPEGVAFDMLSIAEVKNEKFASGNKEEVDNFAKSIFEQMEPNVFLKIIRSETYNNLFECNKELFDIVDKAKRDEVSASTVDIYNWMRWVYKNGIHDLLNSHSFKEAKSKYGSWTYIKSSSTFHLSIIDEEIKPLIENDSWTLNSSGYFYGSGCKDSLHRFIYKYFNGPIPEGFYIDHVNRTRLDNRKNNLRAVSPKENNLNRNLQTTNKTGVNGVHLKSDGRFGLKFFSEKLGKSINFISTDKRKLGILRDALMKKEYDGTVKFKLSVQDASKEEVEEADKITNLRYK